MRIGSVGGYGFDPYHDYTAALQKSIRFSGPRQDEIPFGQPEGDQVATESVAAVSSAASAPAEDPFPKLVDDSASSAVSVSAEVPKTNPAIMEALRSVRKMTEDVVSAATSDVVRETPGRRDIRSMLSEMEDFQLSGGYAPAAKLETPSDASKLKKDSILQEYQYFVSPSEEANHLEQDGIFFAKTY